MTCQKTCQPLAPSMRAASSRDRSTDCRAARKYTMLNPTHSHSEVSTMAGITRLGVLSHRCSRPE